MGRKVLLIEDDADIAAMLSRSLGLLGYGVVVAGSCRKAAEIAASEADHLDVVLCDVMLPDGPGPSAAKAVLRHCPHAWTVFTSGYPIDVLAERGVLSAETLAALEASYLQKPFLPRDLHKMIERRFAAQNVQGARVKTAFAESWTSYGHLSY